MTTRFLFPIPKREVLFGVFRSIKINSYYLVVSVSSVDELVNPHFSVRPHTSREKGN